MNLFHFTFFICGLFTSHVNGSAKNGYDDDGEYIGNPDDDAIIERPCEVYDIPCIREYFVNHAKCTIARGPLPDPDPRTQTNYYIPISNLTAIVTEIKLTGFNNTSIEEFYINRKTNHLIMALNFRGIELVTPSTYYKFYRRGREPIVTFLSGVIQIYAFTVTVIIPNAEYLELDQSEMTVFLQAASFVISPSVFEPPDIQEFQSVASLLTNFPTVANEVAFAEAYYYGSNYIQSNICDFGYEII